ncbi:hypothetical protein Pth03_31880 [Planotetraspora thailandica]|uniref:Uncharacterized protein n=1 Tax=Planotetraspora thailandica TaxID=487172 RepID=A0A8J3XVX1_9ACTN|nr:hypothetical protein Pth03_31880 [Planotetraspora thailandica]
MDAPVSGAPTQDAAGAAAPPWPVPGSSPAAPAVPDAFDRGFATPGQATPAWSGTSADPAQQAPASQDQGADPYKPFVTAGQISGPKTPPAHRQQELWDTVFGDEYQSDEYDDEEQGRPIWVIALVVTVLLALIGIVVWAFLAGPLSSGDSAGASAPTPKPSTSATSAKPTAQFPALAAFTGKPSPVRGKVNDTEAAISLPKLGGPWRVDTTGAQTAYGFTTRQFVSAGVTTAGKREYAQVMSGPLPQSLSAKYTSPNKLSPVVAAVMTTARQSLFPKGNKAAKLAQQRYSHNGLNGLLVTYKVTVDQEVTTVAVAALDVGKDVPSIVYVSVPGLKDNLLPDINTVFASVRPIG